MRRLPAFIGCFLLIAAGSAVSTGSTFAAPAPSGTGVTPLDQVVPAPAAVTPAGDPYSINAHTTISAPDSKAGKETAEYLARLLRPATGYELPVTSHDAAGGIVLRLVKASDSLGDEGYRLESTSKAVIISAPTQAGLFHGVQTLRQLLPAAVEARTKQNATWQVAGGTITDTPRYGYRGAMLDVARHFYPVDQVKRYIDQLALYKFNKLHLHLSDDQGWRIAIDSWPRLATYGGSTQVGGGAGGYYTKAQYREIVRYAAARQLTVVPEIDMPGHTNAALSSYAKLNCNGIAPAPYTGTEVGFSSLCAGKEATYDFIDDVVREVAKLTPGRYLHIGGDEAKSTEHNAYVSFMNRAQKIVAKYGKTVVGWQEITSTKFSKGTLAQYWGSGADKEDQQVVDATEKGIQLIMSPSNHAYLDMKYDKDTPLGTSWAGYVDAKRSYEWDPGTFLAKVSASSVVGVEAPLWTETVTPGHDTDQMLFPRLPGIAELGWSPASTHSWDTYKPRLAAQGPRWKTMGIGYYPSPEVPWPSQ